MKTVEMAPSKHIKLDGSEFTKEEKKELEKQAQKKADQLRRDMERMIIYPRREDDARR